MYKCLPSPPPVLAIAVPQPQPVVSLFVLWLLRQLFCVHGKQEAPGAVGSQRAQGRTCSPWHKRPLCPVAEGWAGCPRRPSVLPRPAGCVDMISKLQGFNSPWSHVLMILLYVKNMVVMLWHYIFYLQRVCWYIILFYVQEHVCACIYGLGTLNISRKMDLKDKFIFMQKAFATQE